VTFIVGLHCYDGLVMCTDSLESDGINKKIVMKLQVYMVLGEWGLLWGCSGSGPGIKNFSDKLKALLKDGSLQNDPFDKATFERTVETAIEYMHSTYPKEHLSMLIGLWNKRLGDTSLYQVYGDSNCLSPVPCGSFCCTGMDDPLANMLLESCFDSLMNVTEAARLGVFVTSIMAERADGVGGPIEAATYKKWDGLSHCYEREEIAEIEGRFPPRELYQVILDYWASKNGDVRGKISRGHF
jgi:20S proteasome alpha/beta subunit